MINSHKSCNYFYKSNMYKLQLYPTMTPPSKKFRAIYKPRKKKLLTMYPHFGNTIQSIFDLYDQIF